MKTTILLLVYMLLIITINSYILPKYNRYNTILKMAQIRYQGSNEKELVKKSSMIFIAPMDNFNMDEAELFKKSIPEKWEYSVLSNKAVIEAIDGTPFCLLTSILSTSNFCIFVFDDDIQRSNDILNTCLNKVLKLSKTRNYEYAICRKGHLIYINESEIVRKSQKKYENTDNLINDDDKRKMKEIDEMEENEYMNQLKNLLANA